MKKSIPPLLLAFAAWAPLSQAGVVVLTNNSFESPTISTTQFGGTAPGWTFVNGAPADANARSGITANGLAQAGGNTAPDGTQMGFVNKIGYMTSDLFTVGETDATHVKFTFMAAQGTLNSIAQTVQVFLDTTMIYQFVPTGATGFKKYETPYVDLSLGSHFIKFVGLGGTVAGGSGAGQASWAYLDKIEMAVPEPGTMWLFGSALSGLFLQNRKKVRNQG